MSINDYSDIARKIRSAYDDYRASQRSSAINALRIGILLQQVADGLPHGEYGRWVEQNCPFSLRAAAYYRAAVRNYPEYADVVRVIDELGISALNERQRQLYDSLADMPRTLLYLAHRADVNTCDTTHENASASSPTAELQLDAAEIAAGLIAMASPTSVVTRGDVKAVTEVMTEALVTGAIDPGEGLSVPLSEAIHSAVTSEIYESMQRQRAYIADARAKRPDVIRIAIDLSNQDQTLERFRAQLESITPSQLSALADLLQNLLNLISSIQTIDKS